MVFSYADLYTCIQVWFRASGIVWAGLSTTLNTGWLPLVFMIVDTKLALLVATYCGQVFPFFFLIKCV